MRFVQTAATLLSLVPLGMTGVVPVQELEKRQSGYFITSGPPVETTNQVVPARQEIRTLQSSFPDVWNLYLLGLARMQATAQSTKTSFYQIAGIHGRPYTSWDNVGPASGQSSTGYCPHSSTLFAPWHRPYLAAYEQIVYGFVKQVASEFPSGATRDKYVAAANQFRIPYWDWAVAPPSGQSSLPSSISSQTVSVITPSGSQTINNPLFSYKFNPLSTTDFPDSPFRSWPQTLRYPTSSSSTATSQNSGVASRLDNGRNSIRSRLYNLFASQTNFARFTTKAASTSSSSDSLEAVHDTIHGTVGSNGHMSYVDYSAFDPIFFLHHTMIDRSFALWQVLNPNSYISSATTQYGTYTIRAGSTVDGNTALTPFHKDQSNYHTSNGVRSVTALGYTYPELTNGSDRNAVAAAINKLYGNGASSVKKRDLERRAQRSVNHKEYVTNFYIPRKSLSQSVFVYFFLDAPKTNNPTDWPLASNLVGSHTFFVKPCDGGNCADGASSDFYISAAMPLTDALSGRNQLGGGIDLTVLAYVKANLHVRFATMDDKPVSYSSLSGLTFRLSASVVTEQYDDSLISGLIGSIWSIIQGLPIGLPSWGQPADYPYTPRYS